MGMERVEERKEGGEKGWGTGRVGEGKVRRNCAVLKIPLKSTGLGPSLTLRQIDALQSLPLVFRPMVI